METSLLNDILIIFGLAIAILFISHRLRVPTIVGLLLTGMLAGPHGLGVISGITEIEVLAEIGVVLLLFTIGSELSLKDLWELKKAVLIGGSAQVLLTILVVFVLASQFGLGFGESVFIGFLISLSSTAIVLKTLQERAEMDTCHGRTTLSILIFQDVIIVPMILVTPMLAGVSGELGEPPIIIFAKGLGLLLLIILSAKWVVPHLLYQIARTLNRELFLLSIIFICFSIALLTYNIGLSLALGAFLAGLIISESEYSHQALGNILPFRDVFMSFFFVSIGMLLDIDFFLQNPGLIVLMALVVFALKTVIASLSTAMLGYHPRIVIIVGLSLFQVGEFSFILSRFGVEYGLLAPDTYQLFLAVSVMTMAATPFIIQASPHVAHSAMQIVPTNLISHWCRTETNNSDRKIPLDDHLIIIGFGVNGRNMARAARVAGIPYVIIEINPEIVRKEKSINEPIYYGDSAQESVLEHANIKGARVLVLGISDPVGTRKIISIAHHLNPNLHIITRTRYLQEMGALYDLGANEVIPQEFETSVEIFVRVLKKYLIPKDEIEKFSADVRADGYEMFRSLSEEPANLFNLKLDLPDIEINTIRVEEGSYVDGKNLIQIQLRKKYGVTVLAIRRGSQTLPNPDANMQFFAGDIIVLLGSVDNIADADSLFVKPFDADEPIQNV